MNSRLLLVLGAAMAVGGVGAATVWSEAITVDTRSSGVGPVRAVAPVPIGYSADWVLGAKSPAAHCVLVRTANPGVPGSVDETVVTSACGEAGAYELAVGAKGERVFRFVLQAFEGATLLGALTNEVSLGQQVAGAEERVDTTPGRLQRAVDSGAATVDLQCATDWVAGAASVEIAKTRTPWLSRTRRGTPVTSVEMTRAAPFDGVETCAIPKNEGADYSFALVFKDASGQPIGDPLVALYSMSCRFGLSILLR